MGRKNVCQWIRETWWSWPQSYIVDILAVVLLALLPAVLCEGDMIDVLFPAVLCEGDEDMTVGVEAVVSGTEKVYREKIKV